MKGVKLFGVGIKDNDDITQIESKDRSNGRKVIWRCPYYQTWMSVLRRSHSEVFKNKSKTYKDVVSDPRWHYFSSFKKWMQQQDWEGKDLDKDWIYDIPSDKVWEEREKDLTELTKYPKLNITVVPVSICNSEKEAKDSIRKYMEYGYEGTIIRNLKGKYEFGQRSNDLLKWKVFESDEAFVYSVEIDKNSEGILLCRLKNGVEFRCKIKGSHDERLYENQLNLVGKHITFNYQQLSVDGVPIFPVGIAVREVNENWSPME